MLPELYKRKSFLHRIFTSDENWIHYEAQATIFESHATNEINAKAEFKLWHDKALILGIPQWYHPLWAAEIEPDDQRGSVPNITDTFEAGICLKTHKHATRYSVFIIHYDNAQPHVARSVVFVQFLENSKCKSSTWLSIFTYCKMFNIHIHMYKLGHKSLNIRTEAANIFFFIILRREVLDIWGVYESMF